ncbi:hypothetical protein [Pseudomonas cremoricolorata]|uniref:Uncharacterized protein n=1 Tax=Pseudomonas cremoricolorata TaxID=157783 RepID=A0A089WGN2_9PSED|nr:hypothetical protein [Pseudomonas cremoricolorata]AIR87736.1 hypothetical protein LK03_00115 [Pseudomonas cremoricolorata]
MPCPTETFLHIIAQIEHTYRHELTEKRKQRAGGRAVRLELRYFWFAIIAPSILAITIAGIGGLFAMDDLFVVSWILIALSYLSLLLYPFVTLYLYRESVKKVLFSPFGQLLEANVRHLMAADARHLPDLLALDAQTLKVGLLELKSGRDALSMRTHLVCGALHKVGILPGLLALILGLAQALEAFNALAITVPMDWFFAIAVINLFFFMLSGYAQVLLGHHTRMIALCELAIELKEAS